MAAQHLAGRTAVVTGGASGIGLAIAIALAEHGADVAVGSFLSEDGDPGALTHRPSRHELDDAAVAIAERGVASFAASLDVRSPESVDRFHDATVDALGPVDVLVNAAGIGGHELVAEHSDETWLATIDVNLNGAYRTIRRCLPGMIDRGWGRIINIASTAGNVGSPGLAAYCASKAGLLGLTRCVGLEGAAHGVTCNAINPGQVDTPSTRLSFDEWKQRTDVAQSLEDYKREWADGQPQQRLIQPEEIGALVAFLCTDRAFGISTEAITVAGGSQW